MFELKSTYLNSAYLGPMPLSARAAVEDMCRRSLDPGSFAYDDWYQLPDQVRARFGALLGVAPDHIALSTSVAELVSHVANGLSLKPGNDVIVMDGDYPSMVLPWMVAAENLGFTLRKLPRAVFQEPSRFSQELRPSTKFAGCSHVMFNTGIQLPIGELGRQARAKGVLFLADVSQSFGAMTIPREVVESVDILVGVAYKWLLGPYGSAFGYFSERAFARVRRSHASWLVSPNSRTTENLLEYTTETLPGARRFDRGQSPSFLINAHLLAALDLLLERGLPAIEQHNLRLANRFCAGLSSGFELAASPKERSPIICVKPLKADAIRLRDHLKQNGIDISVREGHLRFAFHLFNTDADVDKAVNTLNNYS